MDEVCYDEVLSYVKRGHQVLVSCAYIQSILLYFRFLFILDQGLVAALKHLEREQLN